MNRFRISALISGLLITLVMNGQYSGFDLSKYKLPDIKLSRLDLNINMDHLKDNYSYDITSIPKSKSVSNTLNGTLNLDYYHFRNTERYQGNFEIIFNIEPSLYNMDYNGIKTKNNSTDGSLSFYSTNRFFNKNQYFIEADPKIILSSGTTRKYHDYSTTQSEKDNSDDFTTTVSLPVSVGHGRIEPIEDARLAVYILEELNKAGRISALPSENVVLAMARVISRIKNKRFFDTRIRKITELQVIDSFLVANNVISSHDINYFAVLNDNWDYAGGPVRKSGFALSAGINDNLTLDKSRQETIVTGNSTIKNNNDNNKYDIGGFLRMVYEKPVNLYWQNSIYIETTLNREFVRDPNDKASPVFNYETNMFRTDITYSWQFLPDSRTSVGLSLSGNYQYLYGNMNSGMSNGNYHETTNSIAVYPALNINYYISPQMRLQFTPSFTINQSVSNSKNDNGDPDMKYTINTYRHDIAVHFIYSFF
jgi:hypothetical protein